MIKGLSIFFLALYITTVFSSFLPYIEYAVNYNYISEVLCVKKDIPENTCKGQCHLNKKVAETVKAQIPEQEDSNIPVVITARDFSPAIINKYSIHISLPFIMIGKCLTKDILYQKDFYKRIFHPPTVA